MTSGGKGEKSKARFFEACSSRPLLGLSHFFATSVWLVNDAAVVGPCIESGDVSEGAARGFYFESARDFETKLRS
jgi:hypothetical protein